MKYADNLLKAEKNCEFAVLVESLDSKFSDWEATTLYYSVLHFSDAICRKRGFIGPINSHEDRRGVYDSFLDDSERMKYDTLESISRDARYRRLNLKNYGPTERARFHQWIDEIFRPATK